MNKMRQATIETYNQSAAELAEYFKGVGPRTEDINLVFDLISGVDNPRVIEIGCGDGRDALEIVARTNNYLGFDISKSFVDIAKQKVPEGRFVEADAATFEFPPEIDAIFAFASLLHLDKEEVRDIFSRAGAALKPGGIFFVWLKYRDAYQAELQRDQFGDRLFYYYNDELVQRLAGPDYEVASNQHNTIGSTEWLDMALRKRD